MKAIIEVESRGQTISVFTDKIVCVIKDIDGKAQVNCVGIAVLALDILYEDFMKLVERQY